MFKEMFKEILTEASRGKGRSGASTIQDIEFFIFNGEVQEFRSDNADTVDKKIKTAKFKKMTDLKIIRSVDGEKEDVTHLFVR